MYSILPATVSLLFLTFGLYILISKGISRVTASFSILSIATFIGQSTWAILYQVEGAEFAAQLSKFAWVFLLFIPTSVYHFLTEISGRHDELPRVYASYFFSFILSAALATTDLIINGTHDYFWGPYPKAGLLHILHIFQTTLVIGRSLYIAFERQQLVQASEKAKLKLCITGLTLYYLSGIDYLPSYGLEIYPLGALLLSCSLAIMAYATHKYHAMEDSRILAANIAHTMRTPLATMRIQAHTLSHYMPELIEGYRAAKLQSLTKKNISDDILDELVHGLLKIESEVKDTNHAIDILLALTTSQYINEKDFKRFSMKECVELAVSRAPYRQDSEKIVTVDVISDFIVLAPNEFLTFVIINLIDNALDAVKDYKIGRIIIRINSDENGNRVEFIDNGIGVESETLPKIFDHFFTTKNPNSHTGVGLTFCKNVMQSFGGDINCESRIGDYTKFTLTFKSAPPF